MHRIQIDLTAQPPLRFERIHFELWRTALELLQVSGNGCQEARAARPATRIALPRVPLASGASTGFA